MGVVAKLLEARVSLVLCSGKPRWEVLDGRRLLRSIVTVGRLMALSEL